MSNTITMQAHTTEKNNNALVVMDEEMIEEARNLDRCYDLWTARMIRWVLFKISQKSLVCGAEWEEQQDIDHEYETSYDRWVYYMPGATFGQSNYDMPTHCTNSMGYTELFERERQRDIVKQALKEKLDAGLELTESEQCNYDRWIESEKYCISNEDVPLDFTVNQDEAMSDTWLVAPEEKSIDIAFNGQRNECNAWPDTWLDATEEKSVTIAFDSQQNGSNGWPPEEVNEVVVETMESPSNADDETAEEEGSNHSSHWRSGISSIIYDDNSATGFACTYTRERLKWHYVNGYRGQRHSLPAGLGLHIRAMPIPCATWGSIAGSDALENMPADLSYVFRPADSESGRGEGGSLLMIEAPPVAEGDNKNIHEFYSCACCHKDNSWLVHENPIVAPEMMAEYQQEVERNKNEAVKTLDWLKLFGKNLELLTPMIHSIMKDTKLCQAIHRELLARDIGFLKQDNDKSFRLYGRIETIFANLDRWASLDIDSAIEDIRLILEDHELMLEIIDALDGSTEIRHDRPLIRPHYGELACENCGKNFEELGVLYGSDSSTLMATGCRVCEDIRLIEAKKLLWFWYNNPDKISDEEYLKVFSVEKGFQWPEENS